MSRLTTRRKKVAMSDDGSDLSFYSAQQDTPLLSDPSEEVFESPPDDDAHPQKLSLSVDAGNDGDAEESNEEAKDIQCLPASCNPGKDSNSAGPPEDTSASKSYRLIRRVTSSFLIPLTDQTGSCGNILLGLLSLAFVGTMLGIIMPKDHSLPTPWYRTASSVVGYIYFLCWSVSFYPQVILNFKRKSTMGLSSDFSVLNVVGFACYATYACCFFWSKAVKEQYKRRNGKDSEITVQSNDVAFAVHAFVLCAVQVSQIWVYGGFRAQPLGKLVKIGLAGSVVVVVVYAALILLQIGPGDKFLWLDFLYLLSFVKVGISVTKYIPQVFLNINRKSTVGWNIWNIILDFTGGLLSILQLIGDSADVGDWSGITGNPAKFALGFVSIFFDLIFFLQHYVLYPDPVHESQSESLLDTYDIDSLI